MLVNLYSLIGLMAVFVIFKFGATKALDGVGWVISIVLWAYPMIIFSIAGRVPALQGVTELVTPWNVPAPATGPFMGFLLAGVALVLIEVAAAMYTARVAYLVINILGSVIWGLYFVSLMRVEAALGNLQYFEMMSGYLAGAALVVGVTFYIVGAWNKNPMQMAGGSSRIG